MAPKLGLGEVYPQVLRDDGRPPLRDEVAAAIEAVRRPSEPLHPSDRPYFHGGWSVHAETESRVRGWSAPATADGGPRSLGSERFAAVTGFYVEYVPHWPYVDYDAQPGTGSRCVVPELEALRRDAFGGREGGGPAADADGNPRMPRGPWKPPLADADARKAAEKAYGKLLARLRREEHDAGIAALVAELGRRGIACEVRGSTLAGDGSRRKDAHKATALNRRSTSVYVPFPEPIVTHVRAVNLGALGDAIRREYADSLGMTVEAMEADVAARLVAGMPAAFDGHGVPLGTGSVTLSRRPLGGLVPSAVGGKHDPDKRDPRELTPLA